MNGGGRGRIDEGERLDFPQVKRHHAQDDFGQVGPLNLRLRVSGPGFEVFLGIKPDAHTRGHPPAAMAATGA